MLRAHDNQGTQSGEEAMRAKFVALQAAALAFGALFGLSTSAAAEEVIRIGCPTKTYFPTILATVAQEKGLFQKEGLKAEITVYRGGGETFEAIAAGSADLGTVAVPLIATSRKRGVLTKIVGANGDEWSGWILGVKADSPIKTAKELEGKKVGITSSGSGTDTLALWAQSAHKVAFSRIGVGGGGLVPNLLNNNLAAAVIYSPLSYQVVSEGKVRVLIDFATAMPPNLIGGWTATEKNLTERRAFIQKGLNALYGALEYMRNNPDYAVKTIATNNELPIEIAKMEFEKTFLRLSRDGQTTLASVEKALELAAASGVKDMAPAGEVFQNMPITPTKP
jgi:ABC-type nitrate/sulfonate/bicarbonate transport system substrate-binding protein